MARSDRRGGRLRTLLATSAVMSAAAWLFAAGSEPGAAAATLAHSPAIDDGFEPRDVQTRAIGIAMAIGVAVIVLSIAGLFTLLHVIHARDRLLPPLTPQQTALITPPGPPLQSDPLADIAALRQHDAAVLATYRWLGPDHAAAQIPIERAMALAVGRSLDPQAPGTSP